MDGSAAAWTPTTADTTSMVIIVDHEMAKIFEALRLQAVLECDPQAKSQHGPEDGAEDCGRYRLDGDHCGQLLSAKPDRS